MALVVEGPIDDRSGRSSLAADAAGSDACGRACPGCAATLLRPLARAGHRCRTCAAVEREPEGIAEGHQRPLGGIRLGGLGGKVMRLAGREGA